MSLLSVFFSIALYMLVGCVGSASKPPLDKEKHEVQIPSDSNPSENKPPVTKPNVGSLKTTDSNVTIPVVSDSSVKQDLSNSASKIKSTKKKKPAIPLICEANPGTMEGIAGRSEYLLTGDVICQYGQLHFETERAVWNRNDNEVVCDGKVKVTLNGLILTADKGGYRQKSSELWARNNVKVVDTSGVYEFTGHNLLYNMDDRWLTLTSQPVLKKYFTKGKEKKQIDTLTFTAKRIMYNDSLRIAKSERDVQITRGNLVINCNRSTYFEKEQVMDLEENPVAQLQKNELKGDRMRITLNGEEVTSLALKDNSSGVYYEGGSVAAPENTYVLKGDSLFMKIKEEAMEFVEIFENGFVTHQKKMDSTRINEMAGKFLKLNFIEEKIHEAEVKGNAKSTFYIYDEKRYQGRSLADGDSIGFAFDEGKVVEVHIRGKAKGTYMGEPESKSKPEVNGTAPLSPIEKQDVN